MVDNGYLAKQRSLHHRRSIHVSLTEKGVKLRDRLTTMRQRHAAMLSRAALSATIFKALAPRSRQLERFWHRVSDLVQRQQFAA
jgi:DNA-binding MarR family transcriptional regulator